MRISAIYKIESKLKPERFYIGSAVDVNNRWRSHLCNLRQNKHDNSRFQRHFNKYGEADLNFSILLGCDKEYLIGNEQFFIDSYKPFFNICLKAGNTFGRKHSKETKQKIREKRKCQIMPIQSIETRQKISNANKGRIVKDELREKISMANKGRKRTDEFKQRMSINHMGNKNALGYKHDAKFSKKLSLAFKGKPKSEEHRKKMSESAKRGWIKRKAS